MKDTEKSINMDDITDVLTREALYNAIGLANYDIYEEVDFDSWMKNHLIPELTVQHPHYRLVRRRVIWLIGNWIAVKVPANSRPLIYETVIALLREEEDIVVRLEAALTLKAALDDLDFDTAQFSPYLESSFNLLFSLLRNTQSCDCKMQVLHVMSFLIERVGSDIVPHSSSLVQYIPLLWMDSIEHNLLRCAIVSTLIHLIQGLQSCSEELCHLVIPIIKLSTDLQKQDHVYLLEDGLQLWKVLLYHSSQSTQDILSMFSAMPGLLEMSTENLRSCLKIIEAYALLCGDQLIMAYGQLLVNSLCNLITDVKTEGLVLTMKTVEIFFKLYPKQSAIMFKQLFVKWIIPSILSDEDYPMLVAIYLSLISRITIVDHNLLQMYVVEYSKENNKHEEEVLNKILEVWFEKLDFISQSERKKICAVAIASLIPTSLGYNPVTLDFMVNACVQVMHDVCRSYEDAGPAPADTFIFESLPVELSDTESESLHEKRKLNLSQSDPVFNIHLDQVVWEKLAELKSAAGEARFLQLMADVDIDIRTQLEAFLKKFMSG